MSFLKQFAGMSLALVAATAFVACGSGNSPAEPAAVERDIAAEDRRSDPVTTEFSYYPVPESHQASPAQIPTHPSDSPRSDGPALPMEHPPANNTYNSGASTKYMRPTPAPQASAPRGSAMTEPPGRPAEVNAAKDEVIRAATPNEVAAETGAESNGQATAELGPAGPPDSQGPRGPEGAAGEQGPAGPSGPTTASATIGRQGPPGPPNPLGLPGHASPQFSAPSATPAPSTAFKGSGGGRSQPSATTFHDNPRSPAVHTSNDAVSTFSLDTDRTSYRLALNWAREGYEIDPDSVRAEEWVNSFNYGYPHPSGDSDFAIYSDVFQHPLDGSKHIARVGIQAPYLRDDSRALNVTLVLDASGSMAEGNRVAIAREAAESLRDSLRPQDRIAVVHFSEDVLSRHTVTHTDPNDRRVRRSINRLQPGGATNVQAGLDLGVQLADSARRERPDAINYVILMSDGVANVDATNPFAILESAVDYNGRSPLRLVTIGVGIHNYNDYLLEQLAQHGNGWYRYLDNIQQAQSTFSRDNWLNLAIPFADQTRAQITWNPEMVRTWRIVGYENRVTADKLFTQNRREFAEIPSGAATTVFYELELTSALYRKHAGNGKLGDVEVRWVEPARGVSRRQNDVVTGSRWQDFDSLEDPLLKLGTVIALAADRYSALPYSKYRGYAGEDWELSEPAQLSELSKKLELLKKDLGHLTAYEDFSLLMERMTRYAPPERPTPRGTGYSP